MLVSTERERKRERERERELTEDLVWLMMVMESESGCTSFS